MGRPSFGILLAALAVVSPLAIHFMLTGSGSSPQFAGTLVALQFVMACCLVFARVPARFRAQALAALAVLGAVLCAMRVTRGLVLASALPHALIYSLLLALFGSSLRAGREPVVTFLARVIHGPPGAALAAYTRKVTWAWCAFFTLQLTGSALLLALAPVAWWSLFVNVLNAPLLIAMFVVERAARPLWLADAPREDFAATLGMFRLLARGTPVQGTRLP